MKKIILTVALPTLLGVALIFTSCSTPAEKVKDAKENVVEAKKDLKDAKEAYLADIVTYRKYVAERIETNNQSIVAFTKLIENQKVEARKDYKLKIAELEKKNSDLKKRLNDYKENGQSNWETFKIEFDRDMEALGLAFKNLTVNNVK
jgi:PBP1b-binding outer membrane lipoprotein LpoB